MSARTRAEKRKSLRRIPGNKVEKRIIRVFAEGEATELEYIDVFRRSPDVWNSVALDLVIEMAGATPQTLVSAAAKSKKTASLEVDEYWCIYDVESPQNHPFLLEARDQARANGIKLAVSNPCFELWLSLHHAQCGAYLSTDNAISLRARLEAAEGVRASQGGKHLIGSFYLARVEVAMARAAGLRLKHQQDGTMFPHDNPSSNMDEFMRALGVGAGGR